MQKNIVLGLYFIFVLVDVSIVHRLSDVVTLILVLLWLAIIFVLKLLPSHSLRFSAGFLTVAFIAQFFGNMIVLEKSISWFAIFLTISLVHGLYLKYFLALGCQK